MRVDGFASWSCRISVRRVLSSPMFIAPMGMLSDTPIISFVFAGGCPECVVVSAQAGQINYSTSDTTSLVEVGEAKIIGV